MATSEISICNSALLKIGSERITSLTENNKRAILANEQYPKLRDEVLRAHPWNFAIRRVEVAALDTTPASEWDFYYQLPNDCLRVLDIDVDGAEWKVEGRYLATNEDTVVIKYITQITDVSYFDTIFCETLALRLAADLAYPITNSLQLSTAMWNAYNAQLRLCRSMDAQEGSPDQLAADTWTDVRR
jgi:hypothetical protein